VSSSNDNRRSIAFVFGVGEQRQPFDAGIETFRTCCSPSRLFIQSPQCSIVVGEQEHLGSAIEKDLKEEKTCKKIKKQNECKWQWQEES
jgi:hypothetical protein